MASRLSLELLKLGLLLRELGLRQGQRDFIGRWIDLKEQVTGLHQSAFLVRLGQQDTSHPGTDLDFAGTLDLGGYLNGLGEGTDFNDLRIDRQGRHRRGHHRDHDRTCRQDARVPGVTALRSALNTHRETIEVMHLLGSTDAQIAQLFQRRIALDALFGAGLGLAAALITMLLLRGRLAAVGSELLGSVGIGWAGWLFLLLMPVVSAGLATIAARTTILSALRRIL